MTQGVPLITTIQIISLVGATTALILGVIAIWLSLYFYRRNDQLYDSMRETLSDIQASSRTTEVMSRDVLHPVIETILGMVRDSTTSRIDSIGQIFMQRTASKLESILGAQTPKEKESTRKEFFEELNSLLGTLRHEVGKVGLAWKEESAQQAVKPKLVRPARVPGSTSYNWTPFVRRIRDIEETHEFLSVKWLREKRFSDEPEYQEALQVAIDRSMVLTHYIDNPYNPEFPTKCCKLNREHATVIEVLEAIEELQE